MEAVGLSVMQYQQQVNVNKGLLPMLSMRKTHEDCYRQCTHV